MTREELSKYITGWNVKYPYDRVWRKKYTIPLFSSKHREMVLIDILLEVEEDKLYDRLIKDHIKEKQQQEEISLTSLRDREYIPGQGNWLKASEDSMSEEEQDDLFDKIKL